ncbi:NrtR DNA-binding winged helix domain-containing protein [Pedobacter sp. P26]|uniref:NrtR DNA-binding winged helix domain-containing protein n=1 Tax=Pedobacter sp. P26 TaxID=3423956 RepID=UPI003D663FE0
MYELVLGKKLDKRNFRKKIVSFGVLKELDEKQKGVSYRAATLYRFDKRKYAKLFGKGDFVLALSGGSLALSWN